MSQSDHSHRRTALYGAFSFGSVVVSCFLQFVFEQHIRGSAWQLGATFVLGAIYATFGVLFSPIVCRYGTRVAAPLYLFMAIIVTVMLYVSPAKGFFGIIVLPMVSMAIFEFTALWAATAGFVLFLASVGVFWQSFGLRTVPEAMQSYLAAFVFTAVFSLVAKQALTAKERSDQLTKDLADANQKLRDYAAQVDELATTRERNRLAREIHDGVGHYLTVVKTQLDAATALLPAQPEKARESVQKAARLAGEALDDVRRSVGALHTATGRPPLPEALKELVAQGEPVPAFAIEGEPRPLSSAVEHALFRAVQEGLTNIRKHSRATNAHLILDFRTPRRILLELSDNGVGLTSQSTQAGFGLIGLRERIELLGGQIETANRLNGGFTLTVKVPA